MDFDRSSITEVVLAASRHETHERIDELAKKWNWVIGGVVENDSRYVRAIILDFLDLPIPNHTYHTPEELWESTP